MYRERYDSMEACKEGELTQDKAKLNTTLHKKGLDVEQGS